MFSVSKKLFKKAVDRNQVRRRMKEAYRLQKHYLDDLGDLKLFIAYIYVDKKVLSFDIIESKLKESMARLKGMVLAQN